MSLPECNRCRNCKITYWCDHYDYDDNKWIGSFCKECSSAVKRVLDDIEEKVEIFKKETDEISGERILRGYVAGYKRRSGKRKLDFDLPHQFYFLDGEFHITSCGGRPKVATLTYTYRKDIFEIEFELESQKILKGPFIYMERNIETGTEYKWRHTFNGPNWTNAYDRV